MINNGCPALLRSDFCLLWKNLKFRDVQFVSQLKQENCCPLNSFLCNVYLLNLTNDKKINIPGECSKDKTFPI